MVLSVDIPSSGGFFGPGYPVQVRTSLFGPFPDTYQWSVQLESATPLASLYFIRALQPITSVFGFTVWGKQPSGQNDSGLVTAAAFSANAQLTQEILDLATGTRIEPPVTFPGFFWDPYGGLGPLMRQYAPTTVGDSFTAADRQQLSEVHTSVTIPSYSVLTLHLGLAGPVRVPLDPRTRAVRWTVTQFPENVRTDPGFPNYYFNLGFVTPVVASSSMKSTRLALSPQTLALPEACHAVDLDLPPGLTVELAELIVP